MKIQHKKEPKATIKVIKGDAFQIETADHLPKLHQACIVVSKRGTFKTTAISNLLRMYRETGTMEKIIIVSSTFKSNRAILEQLDIDPEDVYDDPDAPDVLQNIVRKVEDLRDDFLRWRKLRAEYEKVEKQMKLGYVPDDETLLSLYDVNSNSFKLPEPEYECYKEGRPPVVAVVFDDVLGSKVLNNRLLISLTQRHRHIAPFSKEDNVPYNAVGVSLYFLVQSFKSHSGLNRSIRNQATSALIGRTKDFTELKDIAESFAGEIAPETFMKVHHEATKESSHDFLLVDLHHKKGIQPSGFRKNFDDYLIVEEGVK